MRITSKMARQLLEVLDELREEITQEEKPGYPYAEWERRREKVKERLARLPEYVEQAVEMLEVEEKTAGRPRELDLVQRTMLFLFARLMNKSNRDMEEILWLLEPLFGFKVSYKSIERLYSDEEIRLVLHNLFLLLLQDEGVSGDFAGDGTGYSLSIEKHYRSNPKKKSKDYDYVFRLIDLETGMYVGFGYSKKSEMEAFNKAMQMVEKHGIAIDSIALDKYYSSRKALKMFDKEVAVYVIPKKNISKLGSQWVRIIRRIAENPTKFLKRYFMRNLSESGFSADKRRFGWRIRQRREDRQEMAMLSIALLHNIFTIRVKPG
ncbi:MAG: ISNCY family transposase [Candidatus Hydrothermarchaeaceae archaeon]